MESNDNIKLQSDLYASQQTVKKLKTTIGELSGTIAELQVSNEALVKYINSLATEPEDPNPEAETETEDAE